MKFSKFSIPLLAAIILVVASVMPSGAQGWINSLDVPWRFSVKAYAWLPEAPVTIKVDQEEVANMPETFDNIIDAMEMSAMFEIEAHKGPLGFFVSPVYYKGQASEKFTGLEGERRKATLKESAWFIHYGASYKIGQWALGDKASAPVMTLEPFAGALYLHDPIEVDVNPGAFDKGLRIRKTIEFNTPIIGLNTLWDFTDRWSFRASGNYGGWDVDSVKMTYQGVGLLSYHFKMMNVSSEVFAGYRYLKVHYQDNNDLDINVSIKGPLFGIGWEF